MVVLILILGLGIYFLVMFGLTFWLQRYHYYKNRFYSGTLPKTSEPVCDELMKEFDATPDPERKCRQKIRNEVDEEA